MQPSTSSGSLPGPQGKDTPEGHGSATCNSHAHSNAGSAASDGYGDLDILNARDQGPAPDSMPDANSFDALHNIHGHYHSNESAGHPLQGNSTAPTNHDAPVESFETWQRLHSNHHQLYPVAGDDSGAAMWQQQMLLSGYNGNAPDNNPLMMNEDHKGFPGSMPGAAGGAGGMGMGPAAGAADGPGGMPWAPSAAAAGFDLGSLLAALQQEAGLSEGQVSAIAHVLQRQPPGQQGAPQQPHPTQGSMHGIPAGLSPLKPSPCHFTPTGSSAAEDSDSARSGPGSRGSVTDRARAGVQELAAAGDHPSASGMTEFMEAAAATRRQIQAIDNPNNVQVAVHNVPFKWCNHDLEAMFAAEPGYLDAQLLFHDNGRSKGVGVLLFNSMEHALSAVQKLAGTMADGRRLEMALMSPENHLSFTGTRVEVLGLPWEYTAVDVRNLIQAAVETEVPGVGNCMHSVEVVYRDDGKSEGRASVLFKSREAARIAIKRLHGQETLSGLRMRLFYVQQPRHGVSGDPVVATGDNWGPVTGVGATGGSGDGGYRSRSSSATGSAPAVGWGFGTGGPGGLGAGGATGGVGAAAPGGGGGGAFGLSEDQGPVILHVSGLTEHISRDQLRELFSTAGEVTKVDIPDGGRSMGYGFITFSSPSAAEQAMLMFNNYPLHGGAIHVSYSTSATAKARQQALRQARRSTLPNTPNATAGAGPGGRGDGAGSSNVFGQGLGAAARPEPSNSTRFWSEAGGSSRGASTPTGGPPLGPSAAQRLQGSLEGAGLGHQSAVDRFSNVSPLRHSFDHPGYSSGAGAGIMGSAANRRRSVEAGSANSSAERLRGLQVGTGFLPAPALDAFSGRGNFWRGGAGGDPFGGGSVGGMSGVAGPGEMAPQGPTTTVRVSGLALDMTEDQLMVLFTAIAPVASVHKMRGKDFGLVTFHTVEGAILAVRLCDGFLMPEGNNLAVQFANQPLGNNPSAVAAAAAAAAAGALGGSQAFGPLGDGVGGMMGSTHGALPPLGAMNAAQRRPAGGLGLTSTLGRAGDPMWLGVGLGGAGASPGLAGAPSPGAFAARGPSVAADELLGAWSGQPPRGSGGAPGGYHSLGGLELLRGLHSTTAPLGGQMWGGMGGDMPGFAPSPTAAQHLGAEAEALLEAGGHTSLFGGAGHGSAGDAAVSDQLQLPGFNAETAAMLMQHYQHQAAQPLPTVTSPGADFGAHLSLFNGPTYTAAGGGLPARSGSASPALPGHGRTSSAGGGGGDGGSVGALPTVAAPSMREVLVTPLAAAPAGSSSNHGSDADGEGGSSSSNVMFSGVGGVVSKAPPAPVL